MLNRTFGCVRVVWNRTLAARQARWHTEGTGTSYAASDRALTAMKRDPELAFLSEVSCVPLQQALRHQPRRSPRSSPNVHATRSSSPAARGSPRTTPGARSPCAAASCEWPRPAPRCGPRHLERRARSLARYQRRLARRRKGSANRAKAAAKVARAHRKVRNARRDFLHRASTRLVRRNDVIVIEDLNVSGMVRNRHLARAISGVGWGEFRRQLAYRCQRYGRRLVVIDRWYPSSKICSACGHRLAELSLSARQWTCLCCGTRHDRDVNAAKNILAAGRAVARGSLGDACGAGVRHPGSSRVRPAVNQEPQSARTGIPVLQGGE